MSELFFWRTWTLPERRAVWLVMGTIVTALIFILTFSGIFADGGNLRWDVISILNDAGVPANSLDLGAFTYEISVPSVVVTEQYAAPLMMPDTLRALLSMIIAMAGLSLVLAALTSLERFWYIGGMAVFILLLAFSRTEVITFAGFPERTMLIIALVAYVGTGYYFHAFRRDVPMVTRVLAFLVLSGGMLGGIHFLSSAPQALYTYMTYSLPLWLIPSLIFLVVCATEIVYGLVWLTTSKETRMGERGLPNLMVILLVYLIILIFTYVGNTKLASWGMVLVPVYLLGGLAALIGVFNFRKRCESTEGQLPFRESGFWLYQGLFLITLGMTGMALASQNDPLLEVMEDMVVNAQLGMSAAFIFYLVINFLPLLRQGLSVHKVLYKPLKFSLPKARLIGFGIVVVLFSMQNLFPLKQGIAGYFNGVGDAHVINEQYQLAEQYYKMALQQEFQNHKANYTLASLARIQGDNNAAVYYFRQATLKKPSPQAYVGLANLLMEDNLYFEGLFRLKEGYERFPRNGQILNNLGLLYSKTNVADSAYYYLSQAEKYVNDGIPETNILATLAGVLAPEALDSLAAEFRGKNTLALEANKLLVANKARKFEKRALRADAIGKDSLLSAAQYAYWINYAYNQAPQDSTISEKLKKVLDKNSVMTDELLLASAHGAFYSGDKTRALETLLSLSGDGEKSELARMVLGHWYLQLGLYDRAIEQFSELENPEGIMGYALGQSLSGNPVGGAIIIEKLKDKGLDSTEVAGLQEAVTTARSPENRITSAIEHARAVRTETAYQEVLRINPYYPQGVTEVVNYYLNEKKDLNEANRIVVEALRFNDKSYQLWEVYAMLNLELGLLEQAEEGANRVRELADTAAYHHFSARYQARRSLKQKEREEFQ